MVKQILIILCGSRRSIGDQVHVGPELIRPNQVVNPMRELWRRQSEMEMKSRLVQLCVDASTWSMVAILRLECIRVKREIVRICDWNTS